MAVIDSTTWQTLTGTTLAGADAAALAAWCLAVDAAVKELLLPFVPEPVTVTDEILDAPPGRDLLTRRRPVRSIASLYCRADADGVAANFTSDFLLAAGTDYTLLVDDPVNGWSRAGIVRRLGTVWGVGYYGAPGTLAGRLEGVRGAVKLTYAAGPAAVPADVQGACALAVSLLMGRRKGGAPYASESWNGRSQSLGGPFAATAAVRSPDVLEMLRPYLTPKFGG